MNERYLFRGKGACSGNWEYGYYEFFKDYVFTDGSHVINVYNSEDNEMHKIEICPETLGQCTGLRDKNGVLIFEGDIIQPDKEIFIEIFGVVKFGEHFCCHSFAQYGLYIKWSGDYRALRENIVDWNERVEIVGNIYDNPELWEGARVE